MTTRTGFTFKLKRKTTTDEWVVVVTFGARRIEERCYYTNDKDDARATMLAMFAEEAAK